MMKIIRKPMAIMIVMLLIVISTGCTKSDSRGDESERVGRLGSMNSTVQLETADAVRLLERNGIALSRTLDFPVDLSKCKILGEEPQPYFSSETGVYYMFYQFDDYTGASEMQRQMRFYDYPDCAKEFSDYVIPGCAGKNLVICVYCPALMNWVGADGEKERREAEEQWMAVYKESSSMTDILDRKAFNQKSLVLIGRSENWQVVVPVSYMLNQMENKDGIIESQFRVKNSTFLKFRKSEGEPPRVSAIKTRDGGSGESRSWTDDTLLENKEIGYGFYRTSGVGASEYNPEVCDGITITITWGENGQTEEIMCLRQGLIPQDLLGEIWVKSLNQKHLDKEII